MIKSLYPTFQRWSEKGSVWIVSDTHFDDDDRGIMGYTISTEEHVDLIKKKIGKNDTLIHLGDVGNPEYFKNIKGYKVLIMGNHDQSVKKFELYFDEIYTGPLFIGEKILLSHEPINLGGIAVNLHGHDHNASNDWSWNCMNFAANVVGYNPVSLGTLVKEGMFSHVDGIHRITIDWATSKKSTIDHSVVLNKKGN